MRVRTLLTASVIATAGAILPAAPAEACLHVYMPVVGSMCDPDPCKWLSNEYDIQCP
jgi:hypothetical protein